MEVLLASVQLGSLQILSSDAEDIHSWVEGKLIDAVGTLGKEAARAARATIRSPPTSNSGARPGARLLLGAITALQQGLVASARTNQAAVLPGTHLQRAQPVTYAHWALAYVEMLERDHPVCRMPSSASTPARSAAAPWRAPPTPSTAKRWRSTWASVAPPATAWIRSQIGITWWS